MTPPSSRAKRSTRRKPLNSFTPPDHDPLSDSRLRPLVERYASLAGGRLDEVGPHLFELRVPDEDRAFFGGRERVLVAFAVAALDHSPDGEMAVIGSPFVDQVLAAIRARGARLSLGMAVSDASLDAAPPPLDVPVRNGSAGRPSVHVARHPVGRLLARVLIRAGASVEEHLVESGFFDLVSGAPLPAHVTEVCVAAERDTTATTSKAKRRAPAEVAPARPVAQLVELMVADLGKRLSPRVERLRAEAERALAAELDRIDRYYRQLLEDVGSKESDAIAMAEAGRAVEAEHSRRRLEEQRRHQVRAVVHPLQIVELELLVQRATWTLSTAKAGKATLTAHRYLHGAGSWSLTCPACARQPSALVICGDDDVACDSCARECSVCGQGFHIGDGTVACHVDEAPMCADHARTCSSCARPHCTAHEADCADKDGHRTCASCLAPCSHCGRQVCGSHALTSADDAPMGSRRLCGQCVVHCEGRRSEPVGRDEAIECASCKRFVCTTHQGTCDVDGRVHCSRHLVRTDQSERLVCETDRSTCAHEPDSIFAADEVGACPVCARSACPAHVKECTNCGRRVCVGEWEPATSKCTTCRRLLPYPAPSKTELAAANEAAEGRAPEPKRWRAARDATHLVVEMSQGWKRRAVFAVRDGDSTAETVVTHTARGSKRKR